MNLRRRTTTLLAGLWLALAAPTCTQVAGLDGQFIAADAPCNSSADCASGSCSGSPGWCTDLCTFDSDCPAGACIENGNHTFTCFPACASDGDCAGYAVVDLACTPVTTADGATASVCSVPSTP
jgi:hypothetical protein